MSNTGSVSASVHGYVNVAEIRSGEENRKKYGVSDVKMSERKKMWEGLSSFEIDRVPDAKCLNPGGPLLVGFFFESLQLGRLRCELDQAHASLFPFLSFFSFFYKNIDLAKFNKNHRKIKNTKSILLAL